MVFLNFQTEFFSEGSGGNRIQGITLWASSTAYCIDSQMKYFLFYIQKYTHIFTYPKL